MRVGLSERCVVTLKHSYELTASILSLGLPSVNVSDYVPSNTGCFDDVGRNAISSSPTVGPFMMPGSEVLKRSIS